MNEQQHTDDLKKTIKLYEKRIARYKRNAHERTKMIRMLNEELNYFEKTYEELEGLCNHLIRSCPVRKKVETGPIIQYKKTVHRDNTGTKRKRVKGIHWTTQEFGSITNYICYKSPEQLDKWTENLTPTFLDNDSIEDDSWIDDLIDIFGDD